MKPSKRNLANAAKRAEARAAGPYSKYARKFTQPLHNTVNKKEVDQLVQLGQGVVPEYSQPGQEAPTQ